jgi:hypothetical protein
MEGVNFMAILLVLLASVASGAVAVCFPLATQPRKSAQPDGRAILFLCVLGLAFAGPQTAWAQPARLIHTFLCQVTGQWGAV